MVRERYRGGGKAGRKITEFNERSKSKLRFTATNANADWSWWIGLTYPGSDAGGWEPWVADGRESKSHLHKFLVYLAREYPGIRYLWAFEFQKRGAPHYHILITRQIDREWLSRTWAGIVGTPEGSDHWKAGTSLDALHEVGGVAKYLAKVTGDMAKDRQKTAPESFQNVGRFWGASTGLVRPIEQLTMLTEDAAGIDAVMRAALVDQVGKDAEETYNRGERLFMTGEYDRAEVCASRYSRQKDFQHSLEIGAGYQGFTSFGKGAETAELIRKME